MSYKHLPVKGSSFDLSLLDSYFKKDGTSSAEGDFDLDGNLINNLADPVDSGDATNKDYVDSGLAAKASIFHTHQLEQIVAPNIGNGLLVSTGSTWEKRTTAPLSDRELGNGIDGSVVISTSVSITRNMYYNNLTIDNLGILNTNGFCVFVKGILQINTGGIIRRNGNNGTNATNQTGGAGGTLVFGSVMGNGSAGNVGATGLVGTGVVANTAANAGLTVGGRVSGAGGPGGSGGAGAGGAFRAGTTATTFNWVHYSDEWIKTTISTYSPSGQGAPGGSSGAGDGVNLGRGGGGGGSGGGAIFLLCDSLNNNGQILAVGGNGGNGASGVAGNVGGGGGGGGGSGGCIVIFCNVVQTQGFISVSGGSGGTGGAGFGTGTSGGNGVSGSSGTRIIYTAFNNAWTVF